MLRQHVPEDIADVHLEIARGEPCNGLQVQVLKPVRLLKDVIQVVPPPVPGSQAVLLHPAIGAQVREIAECEASLREAIQHRDHQFQLEGHPQVVAVEERQVLAPGEVDAAVARGAHATVFLP